MVAGLSPVVLLNLRLYAWFMVISLDGEYCSLPLMVYMALVGYSVTLSNPRILTSSTFSSLPSEPSMLNIVGLILVIPVLSDLISNDVLPRLSVDTLDLRPILERLIRRDILFWISLLFSASDTLNSNS